MVNPVNISVRFTGIRPYCHCLSYFTVEHTKIQEGLSILLKVLRESMVQSRKNGGSPSQKHRSVHRRWENVLLCFSIFDLFILFSMHECLSVCMIMHHMPALCT